MAQLYIEEPRCPWPFWKFKLQPEDADRLYDKHYCTRKIHCAGQEVFDSDLMEEAHAAKTADELENSMRQRGKERKEAAEAAIRQLHHKLAVSLFMDDPSFRLLDYMTYPSDDRWCAFVSSFIESTLSRKHERSHRELDKAGSEQAQLAVELSTQPPRPPRPPSLISPPTSLSPPEPSQNPGRTSKKRKRDEGLLPGPPRRSERLRARKIDPLSVI